MGREAGGESPRYGQAEKGHAEEEKGAVYGGWKVSGFSRYLKIG